MSLQILWIVALALASCAGTVETEPECTREHTDCGEGRACCGGVCVADDPVTCDEEVKP